MKKIMKEKRLLIVILLTLLIIILGMGEAHATLQANPNTLGKKTSTPAYWISEIRKMETAGGAMGLEETLKDDLTAQSNSNNIDVHMMKTTEYGAIAILSASGYGNPSNERKISTTTGNNSGVIIYTNDSVELVAGGVGTIFSGINSRYFNTYTTDISSARAGDALGSASTDNPGCYGWRGGSYFSMAQTDGYFRRNLEGIFSYYPYYSNQVCQSRGVAVVGTGL